MLEQAIGLRDGGVGLAGARRHLDEAALEPLLGQAPFDTVNRLDLGRPQGSGVQLWHGADLAAPGGCLWAGFGVAEDACEGRGLGEGEHPACSWVGVVATGVVGLCARRLEHERQPAFDRECLQAYVGGKPLGVHRRLPLDARQGSPFGLGLDDADGRFVDVQQVIGATMTRSHIDSRTATPWAANRFRPFLSCTTQPAAMSCLSMSTRARCSAARRSLSSPLVISGQG